MTNAEVLHQVEHGYRMQAPQVEISESFYFIFFLCFSRLGGKCRSFYSCTVYILPNILSFQLVMSKNFFLYNFLY
jgi:hypothetical protein